MFVLHLDMQVKPGSEPTLEQTFVTTFRPAISRQDGFRGVSLLRPSKNGQYRLTIAFDTQPLQQKWVATDLHQQVWPQMEAHCSAYSLQHYNAVE
jgi:heme-degrading monooxygenase HmoA